MILRDKVALIIGGSKGIGRAVSKCFALEGASAIVVARGQSAIDETVAEIESLGGRAVGMAADCTRTADVNTLVSKVMTAYGNIDILVNNVGGGMPELITNTSDELFQKMLDINIRAAFLVSRAVAPIMIRQNYGKIINTASIGAKTPSPGLSVYDGCKAFIVAFTRDLALELGSHNINVNCVCPGHVPTETTDDVGDKLSQISGMDKDQLLMGVKMRMAIKRFPTTDDIARLYLFLASRDSDLMTGQAVNFSCGIEMR